MMAFENTPIFRSDVTCAYVALVAEVCSVILDGEIRGIETSWTVRSLLARHQRLVCTR